MALSKEGNAYLQVSLSYMFSRLSFALLKQPRLSPNLFLHMQGSKFWELYKQDPVGCATVIKTSIGLVYLLACLLEPFMPSFSKEVWPRLEIMWCNYMHLENLNATYSLISYLGSSSAESMTRSASIILWSKRAEGKSKKALGSYTIRPQDRETYTSIQKIGNTMGFFLSFEVCNTMVLDALHLSHYLDFTDTIHYMQDDSTVKGFKEKFAGSQAERRLRAEIAAQLEDTEIRS